MIGVVLIATGGEIYTRYIPPLANSLRQLFPPCRIVLFTDSRTVLGADYKFRYPNHGWPDASLLRYHAMLSKRQFFEEEFSHIFFMDTDMLVVERVSEDEILTDGIAATIHPGYPADAFERRPESTACVTEPDPPYYQACFLGGATKPFLTMCEALRGMIDTDRAAGIKAKNYDESYLNRYLFDNPPAKALPGRFAYPKKIECIKNDRAWPTMQHQQPKIWHLEKKDLQRVW